MASDRNWMYAPRLCNEYIKELDAFIDFMKKICWTMLEETFVVLANIARMKRNIVQMIC
jgi:hypothetical protein